MKKPDISKALFIRAIDFCRCQCQSNDWYSVWVPYFPSNWAMKVNCVKKNKKEKEKFYENRIKHYNIHGAHTRTINRLFNLRQKKKKKKEKTHRTFVEPYYLLCVIWLLLFRYTGSAFSLSLNRLKIVFHFIFIFPRFVVNEKNQFEM